jgi:hypothetical protein
MNRRPNKTEQEKVVLTCDHAAFTVDTTLKLLKAQRKFRVESVEYVNPTGLAEHASNNFKISAKNGSTVIAGPLSTDSDDAGADNSIAAATWYTLTLSTTDSDLVLAAGDTLSVLFDASGTVTLPAGRVVIHGRYL